uniref:Uncharacterized protein n=1 Tax=Schistosoma haematobium TaxID=6185 RepID=A0A094ZEE5_SCHHA
MYTMYWKDLGSGDKLFMIKLLLFYCFSISQYSSKKWWMDDHISALYSGKYKWHFSCGRKSEEYLNSLSGVTGNELNHDNSINIDSISATNTNINAQNDVKSLSVIRSTGFGNYISKCTSDSRICPHSCRLYIGSFTLFTLVGIIS